MTSLAIDTHILLFYQFNAATLPFATSGEARDLLHHLVVEMEMSVNAFNSLVRTWFAFVCYTCGRLMTIAGWYSSASGLRVRKHFRR